MKMKYDIQRRVIQKKSKQKRERETKKSLKSSFRIFPI
jgi:hypothetical protein